MPSSASASRWGCSTRQGAHQLAQKFTSFTPPSRSIASASSGLSPSSVTATAGAGLPCRAEGSASGSSRKSPKARSPASPRNTSGGAIIIAEGLAIALPPRFHLFELGPDTARPRYADHDDTDDQRQ